MKLKFPNIRLLLLKRTHLLVRESKDSVEYLFWPFLSLCFRYHVFKGEKEVPLNEKRQFVQDTPSAASGYFSFLSIGESLLTSLFTFLLISIRVNP